jgi:hypothetical protein
MFTGIEIGINVLYINLQLTRDMSGVHDNINTVFVTHLYDTLDW